MKGLAKKVTLGILVLAFVMGCVISFFPEQVMLNFNSFLREYSPFFIVMIGSIGVNSALGKKNENKDTV